MIGGIDVDIGGGNEEMVGVMCGRRGDDDDGVKGGGHDVVVTNE
jgi:hypothetical protein